MAKCRGCGEEIIFIKSSAGKFIPCNPSKVHYSNPGKGKARVVTQSGEVVSCTIVADDDIARKAVRPVALQDGKRADAAGGGKNH